MVERALIPRVVDLMKNPHFQHVSMALLYHVSVDPGTRGMFAYTPAPKILLDFVLQVEDLHDAPELIALAVNVTTNAKCAEIMCEHVVSGPKRERGFDALMRRGIRLRDPLAFKVIRNVARASDDAAALSPRRRRAYEMDCGWRLEDQERMGQLARALVERRTPLAGALARADQQDEEVKVEKKAEAKRWR